jgi:hypothetical protein
MGDSDFGFSVFVVLASAIYILSLILEWNRRK